MFRLRAAALCLACLCAAPPAAAQTPSPQEPSIPPLEEAPIARYVIDVRGSMARFKANRLIGTALGVNAERNLPTRVFGIVAGAHVYPIRRTRFAVGFGAEAMVRGSGSRTLPPASETAPEGPTVTTRMTTFSPQVSFNFGKRDGYSYVTAGYGLVTYTSERVDFPLAEAATKPKGLNYGGGARWFINRHVAFTADLRFYSIPEQPAATADSTAVNARPGFPKLRTLVLSAGLSIR